MPLTLRERVFRSTGNRRDKSGYLGDQSVIEARTDLLETSDRNILRAVLIYNQPTEVIAQVNQTSPRVIRHRVRRLVTRISSAKFVGAARSLHLLSAEQSAVVRYHIFRGKSLHDTARETSLPYHAIRVALAEADGIITGIVKASEKYPSSGVI